jgi:Tfp pilus assembly protein PilF
MRKTVARLGVLGLVLLLVGTTACSQKRKPLVPLVLDNEVKAQATALTEQGTHAYQAQQYEEAKRYFEQAVAAAPQSGPAHYNYALALNALGNVDVARRHFMEAADLAPGDKIIWDSPALAPHGKSDTADTTKSRYVERPYGATRPTFGNTPGAY